MAKLYRRAGGRVGFRRDAREEATSPLPADAAEVVAFDEDSNAALCADIQADTARYSVVSGAVRKDGAPVATAADGDRAALRNAAAQALADNDAYLALASPSSAQVAAQVRALTRQNQRLVRRLLQLDRVT